MPTYAQLQAEPWWNREVSTVEVRWLGAELCRATGRPADAFGNKGDNAAGHMKGGHRSQEWIERSQYCTNHTYTVQPGLTEEQKRHIPAIDFTPGSAQAMVFQSANIYDGMRRGELDEVVEFYGNVNGDQIVDGWNNLLDRDISSDPSHLWHWHARFGRQHMTNRSVMERFLRIALRTPTFERTFGMGKMVIARDPKTGKLWLGDGIQRTEIQEDWIQHYRTLAGAGVLDVWQGNFPPVKDSIWPDLGPHEDFFGVPVVRAAMPEIDYGQLAAALIAAGLPSRAEVRDAVADLGEGGAAQVREG